MRLNNSSEDFNSGDHLVEVLYRQQIFIRSLVYVLKVFLGSLDARLVLQVLKKKAVETISKCFRNNQFHSLPDIWSKLDAL
jgi:hypothetical protein